MRGVTISNKDDRNVLAIDLRHLLMGLGKKGLESNWRLNDVEAIGGSAADAMHDLSDRAESVTGEALIKLANGVAQVIDGEFSATRGEQALGFYMTPNPFGSVLCRENW